MEPICQQCNVSIDAAAAIFDVLDTHNQHEITHSQLYAGYKGAGMLSCGGVLFFENACMYVRACYIHEYEPHWRRLYDNSPPFPLISLSTLPMGAFQRRRDSAVSKVERAKQNKRI